MAAMDLKKIILNPLYMALELFQQLRKKPYVGAPSSWTLEMTAVLLILPFILPVLHLWDAQIVRAASQSEGLGWGLLRSLTDLAKTTLWLKVTIVIWLVTAVLLSPDLRLRIQNKLILLHGWASFILLSILVGSFPVEIGKWVIGRARPYILDTVGPIYFEPFSGNVLYESFPSGHSMMAGILLVSCWIFLPRWRILALVLCLLLALSRLAVGAHYPTDIVAGFAIGTLSGLWVSRFMAVRNIIFSLEEDKVLPHIEN